MTVIPLRPHRCELAEQGDGTPCADWPADCDHQPRERSVRCARCWDTETWNLDGFCDDCRAWRATAETPTGAAAAKPSTGHREPSPQLLSVPEPLSAE